MKGDLKGIDVDYDLDDGDKESNGPVEENGSKTKSQKDKEKYVLHSVYHLYPCVEFL